MGRVAGLLAFLPDEAIPVLIVLGGMLLIVGARSLAMSLFGLCGMMIVLPPALEAVLGELPEWTLYPIMILAMLSMCAFLISILIGRGAWRETKGRITANVITWFFLFPFRLIGWLLGGLFGRRR
ncbi:MAG: hypothetical protein F9K32_09895 [Desulfobulbaceae bacterium]|nr:MAG: hypothetical protein F9K32_09895 [Desulfobulbaceae bacterium]